MFRFKKSVPVEYDRQGYIYFVSRRYKELPADEQRQVLSFCVRAGGEHYQALFEFVTSDVGATAVCCKHFLSQSTLERIVRKYYILFAESL
jgi:hypothetical protein